MRPVRRLPLRPPGGRSCPWAPPASFRSRHGCRPGTRTPHGTSSVPRRQSSARHGETSHARTLLAGAWRSPSSREARRGCFVGLWRGRCSAGCHRRRSRASRPGRNARCRPAEPRSPALRQPSAASFGVPRSTCLGEALRELGNRGVRSATPAVQEHYEAFLGCFFLLSRRSQTNGRRYSIVKAGASPRKRRM